MRLSPLLSLCWTLSCAENHAGSLPVCPHCRPGAYRRPFHLIPTASGTVKFLISFSKRIMIPSRTAAILF